MIGNSKYGKPFRELLAGVKQWGNRIELALEFPSENVVGQDESPSLQGQDIGTACIWSKRVVIIPSSLWRRFFCYPAMNSGVHWFRHMYGCPAECIPFGINKSGTAEDSPSVSIE